MSTRPQPLARFAHAPMLLLIVGFLILQPLSTDLYLASLPGLATSFHVPPSTVQLTLSLFVIGFGGAQLIIGPLSDRFGRRPILLFGLGLYVLASALCGLASSMDILIAARFLQALGCCAAVIMARAIVRDIYAVSDSIKVVARASSWLALGPLLGPVLGSYLQVGFGWRAAFVVLGLFSAALLLLTFLRLPETNEYKNPAATQWRGLLHNYRLVLGSRVFWGHALPGAFSYGALFSFISGSSFVLINVLHVPTAWFGYCFGFGASGYLLGTIACRRLNTRFGSPMTFRIGTGLTLLSSGLFLAAVLLGFSHWTMMIATMFLTMGAHGINFPIAQAGSVSPFPQQAGTAAGLMGALSMLVAFIAGTLVGASHNGTLLPIALIAGSLGLLSFLAVRSLHMPLAVAA